MECDGFYEGAHGIEVDVGLAEIDAYYKTKQAELEKGSAERRTTLEASLENLQATSEHTEKLWAAVQERVGHFIPHIAMPLLVALIGAGALITEGLLLAPTMDVLNMTDPHWQLITAFGISGAVALAFHVAWESFSSQTFSLLKKIMFRTIAFFVAVGLVLWGIFRGLNVGFAATLNHSPLGDFLNAHPLLAGCFYVFVTLGIPVVASMASHFSVDRLHAWWEWTVAKRNAERLSKDRSRVTKELESERASLPLALKALDEEGKQAKASYKQHHQRGSLRGAKQEPYWLVLVKASLAAAISLLVLPWVVLYPLLIVVPPIVWTAAFLYFRREWHSPGPVDYFELERVRFSDPARDAEAAERQPSGLPTAFPTGRKSANQTDKEILP